MARKERSTSVVDLDELERLEKAAMPGPWFGATSNKDACHWWGKFPVNAPDCVVLSSKTFEGVDSEPIPACCTNDDGMATEDEVSNAHFIAAIRNAAPGLIRELRELRKERENLRSALSDVLDNVPDEDGRNHTRDWYVQARNLLEHRAAIDAAMEAAGIASVADGGYRGNSLYSEDLY